MSMMYAYTHTHNAHNNDYHLSTHISSSSVKVSQESFSFLIVSNQDFVWNKEKRHFFVWVF